MSESISTPSLPVQAPELSARGRVETLAEGMTILNGDCRVMLAMLPADSVYMREVAA